MDASKTNNRPRRIKRQILLGTIAVLGLLVMSLLIDLWIVTRDWTNVFHFSKNSHHVEIQVGAGHLILFHISNWWTDSAAQVDGISQPPNLKLREWVGFDIESDSRFAACYFANGIYHPPLIDMSNIVFTPHFVRGKPCRFRVCIVPIWIPLLLCALPSLGWLARRKRGAATNTAGNQSESTRPNHC